MKIARLAFVAALTLPVMMTTASAQKTHVVMGTATPGGGFPLFGDDAAAETINETDTSLAVETAQHQGQRREHPAARRRQDRHRPGGGRAGLRGLRGHRPRADQPEDHHRDLFQPRHVRGEGRQPGEVAARPDRQADRLGHARVRPDAARRATSPTGSASTARRISSRIYLEQGRRRAGDGGRRPRRRAVGRRHRLAGLHRGDAGRRPLHRAHAPTRPSASAPSTISSSPSRCRPAPIRARRSRSNSVGSWSYILARPTLDDDVAYRLATALHHGHAALVKRLDQGRETTPQNTFAAAPSPGQIHPGVQRYLREIGVMR